MPNYLQNLRQQRPALNDFSDDEIISILPEYDPQEFGNLTPDQVRFKALDDRSAIRRGFSAGVDQLQAMGGGAAALVGDVTGMDSVRDWGLDVYRRNMEEAALSAPETNFLDIDGVGDALNWAGYTLGNLAPMMATSIAGGGVGGMLAKQGVQKTAAAMLANLTSKGMAADIAKQEVGKFVAKRVALGQALGAGAASTGMSSGSIYGETGDAAVSAIHGAIAGSIDTLPIMRLFGRFGVVREAKDALETSVIREIAKQGLAEASTEAVQTFVEQHANYWVENEGRSLLGNLGDADWREIIEASAAGMLGGGVMGGGASVIQRDPLYIRKPAPSAPDDDLNKAIDAANQAAAQVTARGGDALSAEMEKARVAGETIPAAIATARRMAQELYSDPVTAPASPQTIPGQWSQPPRTVTRPSSNQTIPGQWSQPVQADAAGSIQNTVIDPLIAAASRSGNDSAIARLEAAKRMQALSERFASEGNQQRANVMAERAQAIVDDVSSKLPQQPEPAAGQQQEAPGERIAVWTGRRGDGYATQDAAQAGLVTRQRVRSDLDWRIEPMPSGNFQLVGYATERPVRDRMAGPDMGAIDALDSARQQGEQSRQNRMDPAREQMQGAAIDRIMRNIESRGGAATQQEADQLAEYGAGRPYDRILDQSQVPDGVQLSSSGEPFQSEQQARESMPYRRNPGATVVPVGSGFGIQLPTPLKEMTQDDIRARELKQARDEYDQAMQRRDLNRTAEAAEKTNAIIRQFAKDSFEQGTAPFFRSMSGDMYFSVTPSTKQPGKFQITVYNNTGALSDTTVNSLDEITSEIRGVRADPVAPAEAEQIMAKVAAAEDDYRKRRAEYEQRMAQAAIAPVQQPVTQTVEAVPEISPEEIAVIETQAKKAEAARARQKIDKQQDSIVRAAIKLGGLNPKWREDIIGDVRGNKTLPGVGFLFSPKGTSIDDLAAKLSEAGYIPPQEMENLGGVPWLTERLSDELAGRRTTYALESDKNMDDLLAQHDEALAGQAEQLEAAREAEYARIADEYGQEAADLAREYDIIVENAIYDASQEADYYEQQVKQRLENIAAGFADALSPAQAAARDEQLRQSNDRPIQQPSKTDRSAQTAPEAARPELNLSQQTEAERAASEAQAAARQKAEDQRKSDARAKADADAERDDFRLTGSATPSDTAAAYGQNDMFTTTRGQQSKTDSAPVISKDMRAKYPLASKFAESALDKADTTTENADYFGEKFQLEKRVFKDNIGGKAAELRNELGTDAKFLITEDRHTLEIRVDGQRGDVTVTETRFNPQPKDGAENTQKSDEIAKAAAEVDQNPTEAQKEAGNYRKGHIVIQGLDITIENPKGSTRSGTDPNGKRWENTMAHHYGYIKRTEGADGEHVDVFIGPNPDGQQVYVVDQINPDGSFDEHKVMIGFDSESDAVAGYKANYSKGWKVGPVTPMSVDQFKDWLQDGDNTQPLNRSLTDTKASKEAFSLSGDQKIEDLGEKIGGARKDTAISFGSTKKSKSSGGGWRARYTIGEIVAGNSKGKFSIRKKGEPGSKPLGGWNALFDSQQEAERMLPVLVVSQRHSVTTARDSDGNQVYEIWRRVNDRKRVKVVDQQFADRDSAMRYMVQNAEQIIETNTTFGEADLPRPESLERIGVERRQGNVNGQDFMDTFGLRAVEFGNWNNQEERQLVMNEAYDGLLDLAAVLNIPAKAIGLNGDLALAFGARGQGLSSARAHYERDKAVINLTKMKGAGALAHEWFHALDHYFGRQDGKASSKWLADPDGTKSLATNKAEGDFVSHGFKFRDSGVREELRAAYNKLIRTMFTKAETFVKDTQKADEFVAQTREELAKQLDLLRADLSEQKDPKYWKRKNKPASAEQLAAFDAIAKQFLAGEMLTTDSRKNESGRSKWSFRWSNDALDQISEIYKDVRGRSGFDSTNDNGVLDSLRRYMRRYSERLKMLADAQENPEGIRGTPTNFAMDARELDQGRGEDYWTTPHEMAARAFQGYVEDKIAEQGGRSPFLNYAPERAKIETPWGWKRPYPQGDERKAINREFDNFVSQLQTKETETGIAIYEPAGQYSSNERETSDIQSRKRNPDRTAEPAADARRAEQFELFLPPQSNERQAYADLFGTIVQPRTVQVLKSATDTISNESDLAHLLASLRKDPQENFYAVATNESGKILRVMKYTRGTKDASAVYPVDVVAEAASIEGIHSLHFAHNHPSGGTSASSADSAITDRIQDMLRKIDIEPGYHVIVAGTNYGSVPSMYGKSGGPGGVISPRLRNKSVPVTERRYTKQDVIGQPITDSEKAKAITAPFSNSIVLLNNQHNPVALVKMSPDEMQILREGGRSRRILAAINKSNAAAVIIRTDSEAAADNVSKLINTAADGVRVLDWIDDSGASSAEKGLRTTARQGVFFSRAQSRSAQTSISNARAIVSAITNRFQNAPDVIVVQSMQDQQVPEAVRREDARQRSQGASGEPEGFYYQGKAYIVLDGLTLKDGETDAQAMLRVFAHEVLGHHGFRSLFRQDLEKILMEVAMKRRGDIRRKAQEYGLDLNNRDDRLIAAEEVLAEIAQTEPENSIVTKAIEAIRKALRAMFMALPADMKKMLEGKKFMDWINGLSDAEIIERFIAPAREYIRTGATDTSSRVPVFSRPVNEQLGIDRARLMVEEAGYQWNEIKQISSPDEYLQYQRRYGIPSAVSEREHDTDVFNKGGALFWDEETGAPVAYATSGATRKNLPALFSRAGRAGSDRSAWPDDFPDAIFAADIGKAKQHPRYDDAKAGDVDAALEVVESVLTDEAISRISDALDGRQPVVVPVIAQEATGANMIPVAYAKAIAQRLNLETSTDIIQSVRANHTGAKAFHRIGVQPVFEGDVQAGADYLIVDDAMAMGGTLANLKGHIEAAGGNVILVSALTGHPRGTKIAITPEQKQALTDKHGRELDEYLKTEFGFGVDALTHGEAAQVLSAPSLDEIRNRISAAQSEAGINPDRSDSGQPQVRFSRSAGDVYTRAFESLGNKDKTIWERAKQALKRELAPGGLLPDSVFKAKLERDFQLNGMEFDIANRIGHMDQAIEAAYGKPYSQLTDGELLQINEALGSAEPDMNLAPAVREEIYKMRSLIRGLSEQYANHLYAEIEQLAVQGSNAQAAAKIDLLNTIINNLDTYVHRSYRAFDDPNWPRKVSREVYDDAAQYLEGRYREEGLDDAEIADRVSKTIELMLEEGTAFDSMEAFIKESKLGAKDLSVLQRRKQIAPQIRALLGEYTDPKVNFTKTVTKMSRLVMNQTFLDKVKEIGLAEGFLFTEENRALDATRRIAADASEAYAPLNGLYTFPEIDQAFRDALGKEQMADWYRIIVRLNGIVKYNKTVLSPTTAMRNWMSAAFFAMANGHFNLGHMKKSLGSIREYFTHGEGRDGYLRKLKELGVIYDTPYAGEMMDLLADAQLEHSLFDKKPFSNLRRANEIAQKFYQYGDDFWKIIGFENEKALLIKHKGLTEAQAEKEAAERIRNTYPTYSMTGRFVQRLRRFPLAGTFVSFPAEIIRTSYHILRYLKQDLKETPALGRRKVAGLAIASGMIHALQAVTMGMMGMDDDEEEAFRDLAAPWQRNSNLLALGRNEKGQTQFIDMSFLDPYNYWKRPINAMLRDQPIQDALIDSVREMTSPFFGEDIAFGAIMDVINNKKDSGGRVFNPSAPVDDQLFDIVDHLRKAVQPGFMANVERIYQASTGQISASGRPFKMNEEMAALAGFRISTFDPKGSIYFRAFEFQDMKAEATQILSAVARNPNKVSASDLEKAYLQAKERREQAYTEMMRLVNSAMAAGISRSDVVAALRNSGVSGIDASNLARGTVPPWTPARSMMDGATKKAAVLFDAETAREFRRRQLEIARLSRANP